MIGVTGATGFIGRRLLERLIERGEAVRVLVRPASRARLPELPVEVVTGTLQEGEALARFLSGCRAVVHCAGLVKALAPEPFFETNLQGTANLLEHLPSGARLVHLSSLAARLPTLSPYAESKRRAEALVLSWPGSKLLLRPPAVYGPGDRELLPLFSLLRHGLLLQIGPGEARFSLLHVDDLVEAILLALQAPEVEGCFELSDGEVYTWSRVAEIGSRFFRRPVRTVPVPGALLFGAAHLSRLFGRLSGRPVMLTPFKARELRHPEWVCENEKISKALGWRPRIGLLEGLQTLFPNG